MTIEQYTDSCKLTNADATAKLFITAFLIVLTIAYTIGLLFVDHTSRSTPSGLEEQFRGTEQQSQSEELRYEKSEDEMYIFLHNHIFSLSLIFFAVGGIFYFSSIVSNSIKTFLIVEPFMAIITTFGGIWLMRFVAPGFSWLVLISGTLMVGCYTAMVILILVELWIKKKT
jgi:hypothetical protein